MAETHQAKRDDDVARWIKARRDEHERWAAEWFVIDSLLDEYRQCADTGTPIYSVGDDDA